MPSKRAAAARQPRPSPAPDTAKTERFAEEVIRLAGATPDALREDLLHGRNFSNRLLLAMVRLGGVEGQLRPDQNDNYILSRRSADSSEKWHDLAVLDHAEAQWFISEANKTLSVERRLTRLDPSKPPHEFWTVKSASPEERAQWAQLKEGVSFEEYQQLVTKKLIPLMSEALDRCSPEEYQQVVARKAEREARFSAISAPARAIEQPEETDHWRRMLDYKKSFVQDGVRYFPLSDAASAIQAPRSTLIHWINKKKMFDGKPLQTYYFAPAGRYFISEQSIERAANRFVKWHDEKPAGPAGPVTLGEKRDQTGYIGLPEAARKIGVDHHTLWRWTIKGTAPRPLDIDIIKCPVADKYYIRQKDVAALKKLVPRAGLHAGRRHAIPQPD